MNDNWKAKWIWGDGEESPRNEWRCFRKTFELDSFEDGALSISADSRYILYVNGERVGRGPVRSWPSELSYDTYDIGHLLKRGAKNTIAVLVMHFGISNFYYIRGRGGLLAQLDVTTNGVSRTVAMTDESWYTSIYHGYDSRSPRMSCQHGFAERVDARLGGTNWYECSLDVGEWQMASVIGTVGMDPWKKLIPRDIPFLTDEAVYPRRVESLHQVKPISWSTTVDLRNHVMPDSVNHANHVTHVGYIVTAIELEAAGEVTFGFMNSHFNFGPCSINGRWYQPNELTGESEQKYLSIHLEKGRHLFIMETSGTEHGDGYHIAIDSEVSFQVYSPWNEACAGSPFLTLGPFVATKVVDHQETEDPLPRYRALKKGAEPRSNEERAYLDVLNISSAGDLVRFSEWIRPIATHLVSRDDVFALSVWPKERRAEKVPNALQNLVIPHSEPGVVPLFEEADTEFIIDFEKEYSGFVEFDVEASEGTVIDLYGFEYMHNGWRQETYRLDHTLRYTAREGRQRYLSPVRRGQRYVMVTVREARRSVKFYELKMWQSNYPIAEIGRFQSSNPLLNDIWQISQHTTRLCMEDTFVDCPMYEQVFWVGDSRNEALINYTLFGVTDLVKRCLRLVPGSKDMTPLYVNQVPSGWSSVIPNWTFFLVDCLP